MKQIIIHNDAELELWYAVDYYEDKRHGLGLDLEEDIRHALAEIQESPKLWPQRKYDTRIRLLNRFPYGVYYIELKDQLWVVAFAHTSRRPYYWRERIK